MKFLTSCETFHPLKAAAASRLCFSASESLTRSMCGRLSIGIGATLCTLLTHPMPTRHPLPSSLRHAQEMSPPALIAAAHKHAFWVAMEHDDLGWQAPEGADTRLVVNMLRHRCTSYDIGGQSPEQRESINLKIADMFPWLAEEALRQNQRRAEESAMQEAAIAAYKEEQRERAANRRQWIKDSKALLASGAIKVGSKVEVRVRNHQRLVTVSAVLAPKVRITYELKSGAPREDLVYASWCSVPESAA